VLTELGRSQVEVQQCPVRSDPLSWGPAVPTACGSWRSGSEHGSGGRSGEGGGGGGGGGKGGGEKGEE
jgi:hypothetical protein